MARSALLLPCPHLPTLARILLEPFLNHFHPNPWLRSASGKTQPKSQAPFNTCINVHSFFTIHTAYEGTLDTQSPYILEGEAQDHQAQM